MKKVPLALGLLLILASANVFAATTVVGDQLDARWTLTGSPYQIQGQSAIPAGVSVRVEAGVLIVFESNASLDVGGSLILAGTAAYPIQVDMRAGGMASRLWVKGGELKAVNTKFFGGVLASTNGKIDVEACEIARGGGPYLMGFTKAVFRNNKIYGNACGATLDGEGLQAEFQFNTIVQNTYGLQYKKAALLTFVNNSVHDNQFQAVNASPAPVKLDGNFWGTVDPSAVRSKGQVDFGTPKALKDILRSYVKNQLPAIPAGRTAAVAKQAQAERVAVKANARKADAMRKAAADAVLRAERQKKLAEEKAVRDAQLKELNAKRAAESKAKAEELARKKAEAAEARKKAAEEKAAARKAAVEKAEAAKAAAEKAAAEEKPAVETTAPEPEAAPESTPEPTPEMVVPAPPVEEEPSVGPAAAPAAPAQPAIEVPDVPLEASPAGEAPMAPVELNMDIPAPPMDAFNPNDIPAPPGAEAPAAAPAAAPAEAPAAAPVTTAPVAAPAPAAGPPAIPDGDLGPPPDLGGLDLPPMSDKAVEPPADMELPPVDDLGKLDLDLK